MKDANKIIDSSRSGEEVPAAGVSAQNQNIDEEEENTTLGSGRPEKKPRTLNSQDLSNQVQDASKPLRDRTAEKAAMAELISSIKDPDSRRKWINWDELPNEHIKLSFKALIIGFASFDENIRNRIDSFCDDSSQSESESESSGVCGGEAAAQMILLYQIQSTLEEYPEFGFLYHNVVMPYPHSLLEYVYTEVSTGVAKSSIKYLASVYNFMLRSLCAIIGICAVLDELGWVVEEHGDFLGFTENCYDYDHVNFVHLYLRGEIPSSAVKSYFRVYPKELAEEGAEHTYHHHELPVHILLQRFYSNGKWTETDQDLLEWMIQVCPEAITVSYGEAHEGDVMTGNALEYLCAMIGSDDNIVYANNLQDCCNVARFLMSQYPEAVAIVGECSEELPIARLQSECNNTHVQDLAIEMIRHLHEIDTFDKYVEVYRFPFYRKVLDCIVQREKLEEEITTLQQVCRGLATTNSGIGEAYMHWFSKRRAAIMTSEMWVASDIATVKGMFEGDERLARVDTRQREYLTDSDED